MKNLLLILTVLCAPLSLFAQEGDCPGRNLSAFRMSPVAYKGQRVRPFLLNTNETKYIPCSGQEMLTHNQSGKIWVGVSLKQSDGSFKTEKIEYTRLLNSPSGFPGHRNKVTLPHIEGEKELPEENLQTVKGRTLALIHEFNNSTNICKSIDESNTRLKTMLKNWRSFCRQQSSKTECKRAMEVDMLSRTIAFEAHPLGQLDNIFGSQNILNQPIEKFSTSTCERIYIGVTLRNRKYERSHNNVFPNNSGSFSKPGSEITRKELLSYSPYFHEGLHGPKYNIWLNTHLKNSYISACFSPNAVFKGFSNMPYNYQVFRRSYLNTIANTYDTLFDQEVHNKRLSYTNSQTGEEDDIDNIIQHYYHPRAMPKCYYKDDSDQWQVRAKAVGVVACREVVKSNGTKVEDCVLVKNEPYRYHKGTGEVQWVQSDKRDRNLKYNWTKNQPFPWYLKSSLGLSSVDYFYDKVENEQGHFFSKMNRRRRRYCETFSNDSLVGNLAPFWAIHNGAPRIHTITCNLESSSEPIKLGGLRDPRIAPVLTKELPPSNFIDGNNIQHLMVSPVNKMETEEI